MGNKILVLGCCGSGKSVFSTKLARLTGLPLTHLDNIWWRPDGTHVSPSEFDSALDVLLAQERWILDGDFNRTHERRIAACDTAIFLDYSTETCLEGILSRVGKKRPDLPWVEEVLDPELIKHIRDYRRDTRPRLLELLSRNSEKDVLVFSSREEAAAWLVALAGTNAAIQAEEDGQ